MFDRKAVSEGLAGRDAVERQPGHAVHLKGQQQPVPVDGAGFRQVVGDVKRYGVAFPPAQGGRRQAAVDQRGRARGAGEIHIGTADRQVERVAAKRGGAGLALAGEQFGGAHAEPADAESAGAQGQTLDEATTPHKR